MQQLCGQHAGHLLLVNNSTKHKHDTAHACSAHRTTYVAVAVRAVGVATVVVRGVQLEVEHGDLLVARPMASMASRHGGGAGSLQCHGAVSAPHSVHSEVQLGAACGERGLGSRASRERGAA